MWDFVGIVRSLDLILSIKESHWIVSKKKKKKTKTLILLIKDFGA